MRAYITLHCPVVLDSGERCDEEMEVECDIQPDYPGSYWEPPEPGDREVTCWPVRCDLHHVPNATEAETLDIEAEEKLNNLVWEPPDEPEYDDYPDHTRRCEY